jgi:hypothetical protein
VIVRRDPKAVIRDPRSTAIKPVAERRNFIEGFNGRHRARPVQPPNLQGYIFQTGQPAEVREAFWRRWASARPNSSRNRDYSTRWRRRRGDAVSSRQWHLPGFV